VRPPLNATPIGFHHLQQFFFARLAEQVAPALIGCLLIKHHASKELLWSVTVETESYSHSEP